MSSLAMGQPTLSGSVDCSANTTTNIDDMRHCLKVIRINATAHPAKVVYLCSFCNRSFENFVRQSMYKIGSLKPSRRAFARVEQCIPSATAGTHPNPAAGLGYHFYLAHQSFEQCKLRFSHVTPFSRIGQGCAALVMLLRPALNYTPEVLS